MKIAIIAGHGGVDTGANITGRTPEANINLDVALELGRLLSAAGYETAQYRNAYDAPKGLNGTQIIDDSGKFPARVGAELAIHIHHNAGGGVGAEIWAQVADERGGPSKTLGEALLSEYKSIGQNSRGVKFRWNSTNSADYFGVLRHAKTSGIPAVITEYAFLDNSADYAKVDTMEKRRAQAAAMLRAVQKTYPIKAPQKPKTGEEAIRYLASKGRINAPEYWIEMMKTVKWLGDMFVKWAEDVG